MPRMLEIEKRLSMMEENHRHVLYLVTEDRDIVENLFGEACDTLKSFVREGDNLGTVIHNASGEAFYRVMANNRLLVDAYQEFHLGERDYIPEGLFSESRERIDQGIPGPKPVFFVLRDWQILREQTMAHFLKQFLVRAKQEEEENFRFVVLFIISPVLKLPLGFMGETEIVDVPEMDEDDIISFLNREALREYAGNSLRKAKGYAPDEVDLQRIREAARDLKGISKKGMEEILADLHAEFGSFFGRVKDMTGREENLKRIREARRRKVAEFKHREAGFDKTVTVLEAENAIEGMGAFKSWIQEIKEDLLCPQQARDYGNEAPKGVLLTGVPGSGKTQAAKWVAHQMGGNDNQVLLFQFRMDDLLGGLVGDTEANFRRCRKRMEALAPCVVLMDELEKTFNMDSAGGSHEVKMNVLTALLDWMQENKKPIFFFATCNSVSGLRPELLRDGRFDMRFSVFMPTFEELKKIFAFHMKKANDRAGGRLFVHDFDYEETGAEFLLRITEYAKKEDKPMFYTGANVENLVTLANRNMRTKQIPRPYGQWEYMQTLLEAARGKYSQPYGETNMKDIVSFWLGAYENRYANAGEKDLFAFSSYNKKEHKFQPAPEMIHSLCPYDAYMYQYISKAIEEFDRKTDRG